MTILPEGISIRAPREDELATIVEMFNACDMVDCGMPDSSLDQMRIEWRDEKFNPETDAWVVVEPGGRIIGYASVHQNRPARIHFYGRVHPDYRGQGIGSHLLALLEKRAQGFVSLEEPDTRVFIQTSCHASNPSAKQLLEKSGLICSRRIWAMAIELSEEPEQPAWPTGIKLRPFVPERDAHAVFEAKEEAFQDHWGYLPSKFEQWYQRLIVNNESLDPTLWFIAMDGEQVAGIALCGYYLEDGEVEILGVRRPWRRSGLGLALLRHAFGEFYRRGTRTVTLGVDSESLTGAVRLYQRAGMHVMLQYDDYEKELRPGVDLRTQTLAR